MFTPYGYTCGVTDPRGARPQLSPAGRSSLQRVGHTPWSRRPSVVPLATTYLRAGPWRLACLPEGQSLQHPPCFIGLLFT